MYIDNFPDRIPWTRPHPFYQQALYILPVYFYSRCYVRVPSDHHQSISACTQCHGPMVSQVLEWCQPLTGCQAYGEGSSDFFLIQTGADSRIFGYLNCAARGNTYDASLELIDCESDHVNIYWDTDGRGYICSMNDLCSKSCMMYRNSACGITGLTILVPCHVLSCLQLI